MYDLGEAGRTHYITMEYVHGENLKGMIRMMGQLSPRQAISIAKHVCEGLAEAHRLGVVHRDLKSSNIMVDKDGNARIMDFGIARSLQAKGITGAGVMIGTPEYTSPEQVDGKETDQRSDIYSLGVILYEMMTGRLPFKGDTSLSIALKHKTETPPDPRQFNVQIPEGLSQVILKCLEKDRENRFQRAGEVSSELFRIEKIIPTTEREVPKKKPEVEKVVKFKWKSFLLYGGVVILLILLIVGGFSLFTGRREAIDSIAVLPLENLSGDPEQEYFADGITEALIFELTKISALRRVISRTSVMRYKGARKIMPEIARELNVSAVVEGSVLLVGEKVRITAKLIEAETDRNIWAESYKRNLSDIMSLQRELARTIAQEIKIVLTPEEETHLKRSSVVYPEAYQLYLKGRFFWNRRTGEDLKKASEYFQQAIEKDPNYALAYVGLADCYNLLTFYSNIPPKESFPKARVAVKKALDIDETLAEAHNSLAYLKIRFDWDFAGAEREFKRAIELNPNYATAHFWYSEFLMALSRFDEAFNEIKRALELDPVSLIINSELGLAYYIVRKPDQAVVQLRKTLQMDPNFAPTHLYLGMTYTYMKKFPEAIAELKKANELSYGSTISLTELGTAYALAGKHDKARKILEELETLSKEHYVSSFWMALLNASLGENDKAFELLERAYEERYEILVHLKVAPYVDLLRSDPRFNALLKKMGLE
jgi:TolB-like protein/Tfp pilus assembly protein PilF